MGTFPRRVAGKFSVPLNVVRYTGVKIARASALGSERKRDLKVRETDDRYEPVAAASGLRIRLHLTATLYSAHYRSRFRKFRHRFADDRTRQIDF